MAGGSREQLIKQLAVKYGLDPNAVIAIASVEGPAALHGGNSIGDNGSSFGPFQLHVGGALPAGKGNNWANSPAGIQYALQQMAADGARGLSGKAAVSAISSRFERPADVPGEIAKAMQNYAQGAGGTAVPSQAPLRGGGTQASVFGSVPAAPSMNQAVRSMAAAEMLSQSAATAQGAQPDTSGLLALAVARRQLGAAQQTYGPQPAKGPLVQRPGSAPVNLPSGKVSYLGDLRGEQGGFLKSLSAAIAAVGGTKVRVTSGYRSPQHNAAVGGVPDSNHTTGNAMDGDVFIPGKGWVPLGVAIKPVAGHFGLRSGDQPGFFNGGTDPVHVDDGFNLRH